MFDFSLYKENNRLIHTCVVNVSTISSSKGFKTVKVMLTLRGHGFSSDFLPYENKLRVADAKRVPVAFKRLLASKKV